MTESRREVPEQLSEKRKKELKQETIKKIEKQELAENIIHDPHETFSICTVCGKILHNRQMGRYVPTSKISEDNRYRVEIIATTDEELNDRAIQDNGKPYSILLHTGVGDVICKHEACLTAYQL